MFSIYNLCLYQLCTHHEHFREHTHNICCCYCLISLPSLRGQCLKTFTTSCTTVWASTAGPSTSSRIPSLDCVVSDPSHGTQLTLKIVSYRSMMGYIRNCFISLCTLSQRNDFVHLYINSLLEVLYTSWKIHIIGTHNHLSKLFVLILVPSSG